MQLLAGKNILIGVSASIAAYKSALLIREFVKLGAAVRVTMTPAALDFITPTTLSTLSKHPVAVDYVEDKQSGTWNNHVEWGLWPDIIVIAPASMNTVAKMANGICDNFLLATYFSSRCPVFVAPAMDADMFAHFSTQENLTKLSSNGVHVLPTVDGELASGLVGKGRMLEPVDIVSSVHDYLASKAVLAGKTILITAGPTYEMIDPVRFIGNFSTGKMGFALANAVAALGAKVHLVHGPVQDSLKTIGVERHPVVSAQQMFEKATALFLEADAAILSAAVADYAPTHQVDKKIKKKDASLTIGLKPTTDILAALGANKGSKILVGFALETDNEEANAQSKLIKKNLDFIVLNSLNDAGAGFGHPTNKISILDKYNNIERFELKSKKEVAQDILTKLISML